MNVEPKAQGDPTIGELVSQLSAQTSRLVRDEMRLAQQEFRESAKHAGLLSAAGLLAVLGLATLIASAVAALSLVLPLWAAALIIGVALFAAAGVAGLISKKQVEQVSPVPQRTVESVKQDLDEVKEARHDRP